MRALAEVRSTVAHSPDPRGCDLPTCPVCADSMVAAEASAYMADNVVSYLWTCDTCGYGFSPNIRSNDWLAIKLSIMFQPFTFQRGVISPRAQSARVRSRKLS